MRKTAEQQLLDLKAKRDAVDAQIKKIQTTKHRDLRKRQHKREQLVGKVMYGLVESGEWSEQQLLDLVNQHLTKASDRALFDLENAAAVPSASTTPKTPPKAPAQSAGTAPSQKKAPASKTQKSSARKTSSGKPGNASSAQGKKGSKADVSLPVVDDQDALLEEFNI